MLVVVRLSLLSFDPRPGWKKISLACVCALGEVFHLKDRDPFNLGDSQLSLMSSLPPPHLTLLRAMRIVYFRRTRIWIEHTRERVSLHVHATHSLIYNLARWTGIFCAAKALDALHFVRRVCGSRRSFNFHHSPQLCLRARATVCVLGTHLRYTYPFVQVLVIA